MMKVKTKLLKIAGKRRPLEMVTASRRSDLKSCNQRLVLKLPREHRITSQRSRPKSSSKMQSHLWEHLKEVSVIVENLSLLYKTSNKFVCFRLGLDQSFKSVDELNCPICMDYIVSCRTAICGHSFCETCINESLIHRKECPNCRKDIRKWVLQKSDIIDGAVKHMVRSAADAGNKDELTRYEERVQAHQTWMDK